MCDVKRLLAAAVMCAVAWPAAAQTVDPSRYAALRWRLIGPFRGGRTVGATGVPQQPNVFYIGVNNGGVWKTTDYGRTWTPIFDDQPTGRSAPSRSRRRIPTSIYVGSGEGLQRPDLSVGDGVYKSTDAGKTWQHLGLRDGQQIAAIIVDPKDPTRLFVAVLGHPYGPNPERGVFRSTDGGATLEKVLYKDENTGAIDLAFDPSNAQTVYAVLWAARQGPWEYDDACSGPTSGLFKSTDGGTTWKPLTGGLPTAADGLGRIGIGIAPTDPKRIYAWVTARTSGLYRSDDAGESWTRVNAEARVWGRGDDFAEVRVDPEEPGRRLRRQHVDLQVDRRRQHVHRDQGRAGRRRLPHHLDQPGQPRHHPDRRRPGRDHHRQRRRDVELLVQPADGAVLPRHHRQPLSRTGSTAASRRAARPASRRGATTARSRSATGTRSASRSTATSRPIRWTRTSSTAAR